jgi:hypothetical protein
MRMSMATRLALKRLLKGALAAAVAAAVAYLLEHQAELSELVPVALVPLITGLLLALEKWLKELGANREP